MTNKAAEWHEEQADGCLGHSKQIHLATAALIRAVEGHLIICGEDTDCLPWDVKEKLEALNKAASE
jgi:hypothetical protein